MKYIKVVEGIITEVSCNQQEGLVSAPDNVVCGMIKQGDSFVNPAPSPKSPYESMRDLESTRTSRREREARMGVDGAQQWLDDLDLEIEALRPES